jgi:hypothetical protein
MKEKALWAAGLLGVTVAGELAVAAFATSFSINSELRRESCPPEPTPVVCEQTLPAGAHDADLDVMVGSVAGALSVIGGTWLFERGLKRREREREKNRIPSEHEVLDSLSAARLMEGERDAFDLIIGSGDVPRFAKKLSRRYPFVENK